MPTEVQNKRELGCVVPHNFGRSWDIYLACHKIEKNEGLKKMRFSQTLHKICCVFGQDAEYYFTSNQANMLKFGEVRPKNICNTEKVIVGKQIWNEIIKEKPAAWTARISRPLFLYCDFFQNENCDSISNMMKIEEYILRYQTRINIHRLWYYRICWTLWSEPHV